LIVFDEKKYAENLLLNGYKNIKYICFDNIILVKYWKYLGLQEDEIKIKLKDFMIGFQELYSIDTSNSKIDNAIKIGMQYDLSTDIDVQINNKEIELINKLETIELRKMMFILLLVWKFRGKPKRFKLNNIDLLRLSEVKVNNNVFWDYINEITKSQMLSMIAYQNKDYYTINFDLESEDNIDNKVVFCINNFNNPIYYYMSLIEPEKYKTCEECRVVIKVISNNHKYCPICWKEHRKEQQKKWDRTKRNRKSDI